MEYYRTHWVPVYSTTGKTQRLPDAHGSCTRRSTAVDRIREPLPEEVRESRGLLDRRGGARARAPPAASHERARGAPPAQVRRGVRAPDDPRPAPQGRRGRARERRGPHDPADCSRPSTHGCPSSSPRVSVEVGEVLDGRARLGSGRCTDCSRARSARARPSSPCAPCSQPSTRVARRRCSAPTEVLAAQHHRSITAMLGDLALGRDARRRASIGTKVGLLTGQPRREPPASGCAARRGLRGGRHRRRHARPDPEARPVRRPRTRRRRRAAPLRRRAAGRPARERDPAASRARHDRDTDPAHGGDDGLRRHGDLDAAGAAQGPVADHDPRRRRGQARTGSTAPGSASRRRWPRATRPMSCARASATRDPGVRPCRRRSPATDEDAGTSTGTLVGRRRRRPRRRPLPARRRAHRRLHDVAPLRRHPGPRRDAARVCCTAGSTRSTKEATMRAFGGGRDRRPRRDDRHRGRGRRAQRVGHGRRRRRPLRHLAAAPAARPGGPGLRAGPLPAHDQGAG